MAVRHLLKANRERGEMSNSNGEELQNYGLSQPSSDDVEEVYKLRLAVLAERQKSRSDISRPQGRTSGKSFAPRPVLNSRHLRRCLRLLSRTRGGLLMRLQQSRSVLESLPYELRQARATSTERTYSAPEENSRKILPSGVMLIKCIGFRPGGRSA
jgi:hypothetical protein